MGFVDEGGQYWVDRLEVIRRQWWLKFVRFSGIFGSLEGIIG
jgi:hypothetical protein